MKSRDLGNREIKTLEKAGALNSEDPSHMFDNLEYGSNLCGKTWDGIFVLNMGSISIKRPEVEICNMGSISSRKYEMEVW